MIEHDVSKEQFSSEELLRILEHAVPFPNAERFPTIQSVDTADIVRLKDAEHDNALPHILVVTGPSGVGKDAVLDTLKTSNVEFARAISATTRKPRPGESHDSHIWMEARHHKDAGPQDIKAAIGDLTLRYKLLECAYQSGSFYGLPASSVVDAMETSPGVPVLIKTDIDGVISIQRELADTANITVVNIVPTEYRQLWQRIQGRGDELQRLVEASKYASVGQFASDYCVINAAYDGDPLRGILETTRAIESILLGLRVSSGSDESTLD